MARLRRPELEQILAFCAEDPVERVFLEDIARRGARALHRGGGAGRAAVGALPRRCERRPRGPGCGVFAEAVRRGSPRMLIGEERAVGELWEAARGACRGRARTVPASRSTSCATPPEPGDTGLRAATPADFELLVPACAATHLEELGVDPLARDPDGFRWRTRAQIEEGRSWLWEEDGVVLFKAEASAWTPSAVQLQQVWVDPAARGNGYAQRGLRDLLRLLLERDARRLPVRASGERAGAAPLRGCRHVADDQLPLADLLTAFLGSGMNG